MELPEFVEEVVMPEEPCNPCNREKSKTILRTIVDSWKNEYEKEAWKKWDLFYKRNGISLMIPEDTRIPVLTNWLFEVCAEFRNIINIETYFGSIKLLYAFYNQNKYIITEDLQMISCICLHLAYKIIQCDDEDEFSIEHWIKLSDYSFDRKPFENMEWNILETLKFNIYPIIYPLIHDTLPENFFDLSLKEQAIDLMTILRGYCQIDSFNESQLNYLSTQIEQLQHIKFYSQQ